MAPVPAAMDFSSLAPFVAAPVAGVDGHQGAVGGDADERLVGRPQVDAEQLVDAGHFNRFGNRRLDRVDDHESFIAHETHGGVGGSGGNAGKRDNAGSNGELKNLHRFNSGINWFVACPHVRYTRALPFGCSGSENFFRAGAVFQ